MKHLLKSILLMAALAYQTNVEATGHVTGNGGDAISAEFVSTAYGLMTRLQSRPIPGIDLQKLGEAIIKTKVSSEPELVLRGTQVDAINIPDPIEPKIKVNRSSWQTIRTNEFRRDMLVLHEYLGIMGLDDSTYQISRLLAEAVLPGPGVASERINFPGTMFGLLGQAVDVDGSLIPNLCVKGVESSSTSLAPKVIYRLRSEVEGDSAKLYAEMTVITKISSVSALKPAFSEKITAEQFLNVCGAGYISRIDFGTRMAFGKFLSAAQALSIPSLELVETDGVSRAQEFEKLVTQFTQHLPSNMQNWPFKEAKGPITPYTRSMADNFEQFKSATVKIADPPPIQGESVSYPASLWKALIE